MVEPTAKIDYRSLLAEAYLQLKSLRAELETVKKARPEPIALVGMGCRFPGNVNTPAAYWRLLHEGIDAITEVPPERWDIDAYYDPDPAAPGKMYTRYGGFLSEIEQFDPQFFGISPREAASLDPQQRLLLEVSWEALEHAGQAPAQLNGSRSGVFVGLFMNDYAQLNFYSGDPADIDAYNCLSSLRSLAAGRLAYILGLQGPAMQLDTACSSSLLAIHLACQSLRSDECDLALAGGVNLILTPEATIGSCKLKAAAPDGRCKTFDAAADGYARSEGCGMVVLKRLADAQANGDTIFALIRGSAVNHDGHSNGLTAPNGTAQEALLRQALQNAGVEPAQIQYVEAHGTGTKLGDPIEVAALSAVLGRDRPAGDRLAIGSVKTNFGHLESAAGVAALLKVVLALQHQEIPPHLHLQEPNPYIPWPKLPIFVPTEPTPWPAKMGTRLAGVSAFGMSGTNVHLIVEQAPAVTHQPLSAAKSFERPSHLLTLSAPNEAALQALVGRYTTFLDEQPDISLADLCFTANTGRSHFAHRLAITTSSLEELRRQVSAAALGTETPGVMRGQVNEQPPKIAFLFPGQGSHYSGMGRQLYETQPTFRQIIQQCADLLQPYLPHSLMAILYPAEGPISATGPLIEGSAYTQPVLFALQYALVRLWQSWGITPSVVMGHSFGEYVAACVAGVFSLEDGLKLAAARGRLMQALPQAGLMAVVFASADRVAEAIKPYAQDVAIAVINHEQNITISGKAATVEMVCAALEADGIKTIMLNIPLASHSPLVEPMLADFGQVAATVAYSSPRIEIVSNVTGRLASAELATPAYWVRHMRQPVQFAAGMATLRQQGYTAFVEISPQPTLLGMAARSLPANTGLWLPSLRQKRSDWLQLLESLGRLYLGGAPVDWSGFERDYIAQRRRRQLPLYPFQRQRYWDEAPAASARKKSTPLQARDDGVALHPVLGRKMSSPLVKETVYETRFDATTLPFLRDHRVFEQMVTPAACYIAMALAAGQQIFGSGYRLENLLFPQPLVIPEDGARSVQFVVSPEGQTGASFKLISLAEATPAADQTWTLHASGNIVIEPSADGDLPLAADLTLPAIQARCQREMAAAEFYQMWQQRRIQLGPAFRQLDLIWRGDQEALGRLSFAETVNSSETYQLQPVLLDSSLRILAAAAMATAGTFVPFSLERFRFYRSPTGSQLWCYARLRPRARPAEDSLLGDVWLFDQAGTLVAEAIGLEVRWLPELTSGWQTEALNWVYETDWQPQPHSADQIAATSIGAGCRWLIFADQGGVGRRLASRLEARGDRCLLVSADQRFRANSASQYELNPASPEDFARLLAAYQTGDHPADWGVIHLWSLDITAVASISGAALQEAQMLGCGSILHLIQAMAQTEWTTMPRLWLVTQGAQPVSSGSGALAVGQAPMWGLGKVIALEHPTWQCVRLDLDPAATSQNPETLYQALLAADSEDQVAFRQGIRYIARLRQRSGLVNQDQPLCHQDSSYLISGGLGGLGLKVAAWLTEQGARHLVLVGRRGATEAAEAVLAQLRQTGVQVKVISADVANQGAVTALLKTIADSMPPLRGIIHAAAILDDGILLNQDWQRFSSVLAPKVAGAWNLHCATRSLALDFMVFFSSAASVLGSRGQGNYAAANAFIDALAHHRRALGLPGLSINWGPWAEVGLAAGLAERDQARLKAMGMGVIPSTQGLNILAALLRQAATQAAVLPLNWSQFNRQFDQAPVPAFFSAFAEPSEPAPRQRPPFLQQLAAATADRRQELLLGHIRAQVAAILGFHAPQQVPLNQALFLLGVDSLMALELKNRLEVSLGCSLRSTLVFNYPTIEAIEAYLAQEVLALDLQAKAGRRSATTAMLSQPTPGDLDRLSEAEAEALLQEELKKLNF